MIEIIPTPKKNIALDATLLTSLMSCGRLTDYRFNHNLQPINGKSNALECGSLVHYILEYYHKGIRDGLSRTDAMVRGFDIGKLYISGCPICISLPEAEKDEKSCHHPKGEFQGMKNTPEENESSPKRTGWSWVLETMNQYFDFYKNDSWVPIMVEHVKGEVIYEDDEIRILWKAKYDLIADMVNGMTPVDHKTMSVNRDTIDLNNQFIGQCILAKSRTMIINKIGFQTTLKPADKFKRVPLNYSIDRLTEWSQEIVPYWAKIFLIYAENDAWPPNFTHCENKFGNCGFKEICEVDRGMRNYELKLHFVVGRPWDISSLEND